MSLVMKILRNPKIEDVVCNLQYNEGEKKAFIEQYQPFIRESISAVCRRNITEQDDEYRIGLFAFNKAIEQYSYKKGNSFLAFAELLIKRDVIDYIRKKSKHNPVFLKESHTEYMKEIENSNRKEEILHFHRVLTEFKISFSELAKESPKHRDTRDHVLEIVKTIIQEEEMMEELFRKKKLPLKQIEPRVRVSRKTLERHRKYIIAMCIIFANNYIYILDYIRGEK
ncbi:RNA polymerase sigma factor SigI [Bacillus cereus]|uniref:RNA polymerase sigma factor SigI n=1 Tax=Bacillus cereus TaxID=1396 RepID=A0A162P3C0_BACCE|nr:RNA polymerase heat shock sigma factor SigI [Bacillus cereus]